MRIARLSDVHEEIFAELKHLDHSCFPYDWKYDFTNKRDYIWSVRDNEELIAYAAIRPYYKTNDSLYYLSRVGVRKDYRGNGLHKKLIKKRLDFLKSLDYNRAITFTVVDNFISSNNLIKAGFRLYAYGESYEKNKNILWWEVQL